ncbi:VOC family protein [Paenibacillus flagellatus]|uniref:VOC domain-containing protein n=1 Tax=Paenibacillus flagellatus TaxID=2211139 RepID=A0A2V5K349_9BACL|nr:VOC family protein [Paenibacillus flagellatus]PYI53072.1 hypothetical protein DLM86_18935 [Paenibacillus flagellatus]
MVPWERYEEAVGWYIETFDLEVESQEEYLKEKMTSLQFPSIGLVHIKSVNDGHEHFNTAWGQASNVRFCFDAPDIHAVYREFQEKGIRTEDLVKGVSGLYVFDFYDPYATRLTLTEPHPNAKPLLDMAPASRLLGFSPPRISVRKLSHALDWYERFLGVKTMAVRNDHAVLQPGKEDGCPILLIEGDYDERRAYHLPAARPYYVIRGKDAFLEAYRGLSEQGVNISPMAGHPDGWAAFHFFDLDGNVLNVWTFR